MGGMGHHEMGPPGMMEHREMHAKMRMKALHDALNIRPDQEGAFAAFAQSGMPGGPEGGPAQEDMMHNHQAMAAMTTPDRLDFMGRKMDEHMNRMREHFQRHAAAIKGLYAALNPDQRRTFDALPGLIGHPGMGMMGMGMHPHDGMGDHDEMAPGHPGEGD
jgi:hypothetical protein